MNDDQLAVWLSKNGRLERSIPTIFEWSEPTSGEVRRLNSSQTDKSVLVLIIETFETTAEVALVDIDLDRATRWDVILDRSEFQKSPLVVWADAVATVWKTQLRDSKVIWKASADEVDAVRAINSRTAVNLGHSVKLGDQIALPGDSLWTAREEYVADFAEVSSDIFENELTISVLDPALLGALVTGQGSTPTTLPDSVELPWADLDLATIEFALQENDLARIMLSQSTFFDSISNAFASPTRMRPSVGSDDPLARTLRRAAKNPGAITLRVYTTSELKEETQALNPWRDPETGQSVELLVPELANA